MKPQKLLLTLAAVATIGFSAAAIAGYDHDILNPEVVGATSVASLPATCRLLADDVTNMRPIFIDCDDVVGLESAVTASDTEINYLDIATLGTLAASKAWTSDASLDTIMPTGGLLTVQSGGVIDLASGSTLDVAGTFEIANTAMTASAAELNYNDIATLGTGAASKTVALDASSDYIFPAAATIKFASGGTLQVNSTDGAVISAIRTGTDTDLDNGQTSEVVTVTGATASSLCFATITNDTTTEVSVTNVVAAANQATVQVSGDPGASGADLAVVCYN